MNCRSSLLLLLLLLLDDVKTHFLTFACLFIHNQVLDTKGVQYKVIELDTDPDGKAIRAEMADLIGRTSVPVGFRLVVFLLLLLYIKKSYTDYRIFLELWYQLTLVFRIIYRPFGSDRPSLVVVMTGQWEVSFLLTNLVNLIRCYVMSVRCNNYKYTIVHITLTATNLDDTTTIITMTAPFFFSETFCE